MLDQVRSVHPSRSVSLEKKEKKIHIQLPLPYVHVYVDWSASCIYVAGHEYGVTPNRKWAELRSSVLLMWDLTSCRFLRQPLNLELMDRQFCLTSTVRDQEKLEEVGWTRTQIETRRGVGSAERLTWESAQIHGVVGFSRGWLWVRIRCSITSPIHAQAQAVFGFPGLQDVPPSVAQQLTVGANRHPSGSIVHIEHHLKKKKQTASMRTLQRIRLVHRHGKTLTCPLIISKPIASTFALLMPTNTASNWLVRNSSVIVRSEPTLYPSCTERTNTHVHILGFRLSYILAY